MSSQTFLVDDLGSFQEYWVGQFTEYPSICTSLMFPSCVDRAYAFGKVDHKVKCRSHCIASREHAINQTAGMDWIAYGSVCPMSLLKSYSFSPFAATLFGRSHYAHHTQSGKLGSPLPGWHSYKNDLE